MKKRPGRESEPMMPAEVTPYEDCEGRICEYVSETCGTLELRLPNDRTMSAYFHQESVWIPNCFGNPYGPPIPFIDQQAGPRGSIKDEMPIGTLVNVRAVNSSKNQQLFEALALKIWPKVTENPPHESTSGYIELEQKLLPHFAQFSDRVVPNELVEASVHWPRADQATASVCEIKNADFGIIELVFKGTKKFYCFFHRKNVWLRDGKRGVDVEFFREKPLEAMVSKGQPVNVSARSICTAKGKDMSPVAMELQAIAVSLDPHVPPQSAPSPTRCEFGPGVYCSDMSRRYSLFYLDPELFNQTNKEFVDFVDQTGLHLLPQIDQACKDVRRTPSSNNPPPKPALVVFDLTGKVVKHFNDTFGLVQLSDGHTLCLATNAAAMLVKSEPFFKAFPLWSEVGLNAQLINSNMQVSHGTTLIWNPKLFNPEQTRGRDITLNSPEFHAAYEKCNAEFMSYRHEFMAPVTPPEQPPVNIPAGMPAFVANALGVTSAVTHLPSVMPQVGVTHLPPVMPPAGVTPLPPNVPQLGVSHLPPPTTVTAVPEPEPDPKSKAYYENAPGVVFKVLDSNFALIRPTYNATNLVLFDTCDIWLSCSKTADKFGKKLGDVIRLGQEVRFHGAYIEESAIPYIATSVWLESCKELVENPPKSINKDNIHTEKVKIYKTVVQSVTPTLKLQESSSSVPTNQRNILYGKYGVVRSLCTENGEVAAGIIEFNKANFGVFLNQYKVINQVLKIGSKVKVNAVKAPESTPWAQQVEFVILSVYEKDILDEINVDEKIEQTVQKYKHYFNVNPQCLDFGNLRHPRIAVIEVSGSRLSAERSAGLPPIADVDSATLKCMITDLSGVLYDNSNPQRLCYFELYDVNVEPPINLKDLVMILNRMSGVKVSFQARLVNEKGPIQYVAHNQGVQVIGQLPSFLDHITLKSTEKSRNPAVLNGAKMNQFWKNLTSYNNGSFKSISSILSPPPETQNLIRANGIVKYVLNDNFGLVSCDGKLALFDTYDMYVQDNKTAADAGMSLKNVVEVGTVVKFNACFINPSLEIPFLCTSVWNLADSDYEPLAKDKIQADKLNIYEQVVKSCKDLAKKLVEAPIEKLNSASEARREQIERVTSSESYREYVRRVPKLKRLPRDPKTPDRNEQMSNNEWNQKVKDWKAAIDQKYARNKSSGSVKRIDLHEHETTGTYRRQINSDLAIFKLSSGKRILVNRRRVWDGSEPFRGTWKDFRSTLNIRGRKVQSRDFDYQAIFALLNYRYMDDDKKHFYYNNRMKDWIKGMDDIGSLETELRSANSS